MYDEPDQAGIYWALKQYARDNVLRLHMPGHAGICCYDHELQSLPAFDVTEVPGLDDLHSSQGIIAQAQFRLAQAAGAKQSLILVNGATSGIHALLLSSGVCGSKILIPRNSHRSFFGGLVLSGLTPIYIPVSSTLPDGIALAVKADDVEDLLHKHRVHAVFLTSPSYYGTTSDIETISTLVHASGCPLWIDEAHGAHFPFHKDYPLPALAAGADAVVNGLHKTWPVLNPGAVLHLAPGCPYSDQIQAAWSLLTTTSPSYPLMASIDLAREFMQKYGQDKLGQSRHLAIEYKYKLRQLESIHVYDTEDIAALNGVIDMDPLKVLISLRGLSLSGFQAADWLRRQQGIQVELAQENIILAQMSMLHNRHDWERFYQGMKSLCRRFKQEGRIGVSVEIPPYPRVIMNPRSAFFHPHERIRQKEALGRLAGEMIAPYPPGIPVLLPGELITAEILDYLNYLKSSPAKIHGPEDPSLDRIMVLK